MRSFPTFSLMSVLALCAALMACGHLGPEERNPDLEVGGKLQAWRKTELYFGMDRTTEGQWKAFVREVILPRFPRGFTVLEAKGYWLPSGCSKTQEESSKVLVVFHPLSAKAGNDLEAIRGEYKRRFRQESVLRADYPSRVSF